MRDGEGDAFMTNVKTGLVNETAELPIHKVHVNIMMDCANNIEHQFEAVLKNHEKDFMAAYRGHMTKVKKELTHLKKKAEDAAGKLSNDDNITKL
jgi:methyltransferase-like protein|tara:strand:- start:1795 stop:2079 length:285 start_codon:yes stop_codon:yes gene_type:complete